MVINETHWVEISGYFFSFDVMIYHDLWMDWYVGNVAWKHLDPVQWGQTESSKGDPCRLLLTHLSTVLGEVELWCCCDVTLSPPPCRVIFHLQEEELPLPPLHRCSIFALKRRRNCGLGWRCSKLQLMWACVWGGVQRDGGEILIETVLVWQCV